MSPANWFANRSLDPAQTDMPDALDIALLVVDDDDPARYAKARLLRRAGYTVHEARTGSEALDVVRRMRPRLVCLDVHLPDFNGFEVCRRIKADAPTASTLVLQMSATFVKGSDVVEGLEGGADSYLTEPFEPPVLLATVRALLRLQEAEQKLRASTHQWRVALDAVMDCVVLLDRDGKIFRCNQSFRKLMARPFNELIGRRLGDVVRDAEYAVDQSPFQTLLSSRRRQEWPVTIRDRHFQSSLEPVLDEQGEVEGMVWILSDQKLMRELKASQSDLQDKVSDLEKFQEAVIGRELKMMELEKELKALQERLVRAHDEQSPQR
jgi:CheY-like chemotaxis protein